MRRLGIKYRIIAKEVNAHGFFAHYLFFCCRFLLRKNYK